MASRRAVLVGGGINGVLTARELALAGWDVVIVEAAHVGAGSSSRTAAGIRQQFSTPGTVRGMRYAVRFYEAFAAEIEGGQSPIVHNGYLFLLDQEAAWNAAKRRVAMQREAGLDDVVALAGPELRARFPWVAETVVGGTFCASDGFLHPALVYGEGARRVRELGGTIVQGAPVTGVRATGTRIDAVITPKGEFAGDVFFDCTNAWSARTARALGGEELPIAPLKRYLWFVQRAGSLDAAAFAAMPLVVAPSGVYCRPENADTLLMGFAHDAAPEPAFTYDDQDRVDPGFAHNSGYDALPFTAWAQLAEAVPPIGEFGGITATTSGFYATTPDHNPFLDYDRRRTNLIRLVGFSGHGAMFGPFTARVALALAEAGKPVPELVIDGAPIPLGAFAIGRDLTHAESMVI
jgi:sarcosine oxidase subunit beta